MGKKEVFEKLSLHSLGQKDLERLRGFLLRAGYSSGTDYRILEFGNNSEIKIFNKTLVKEVRVMAAFLAPNLNAITRVKKIRLRDAR